MLRLTLAALFICSSASAVSAAPDKGKARFFVHLQAVKERTKECRLAAAATKTVRQLLARAPAVTVDLGIPIPKDKKVLAALLAKRGLVGYGIVFRINSCKHSLEPPPKGKKRKVLMVEVNTVIDAEKLPVGQLALAGSGGGQVGTHASKVHPKELQQLRREALSVATKQAVARFLRTLTEAPSKRSKKKRQRRKRR